VQQYSHFVLDLLFQRPQSADHAYGCIDAPDLSSQAEFNV